MVAVVRQCVANLFRRDIDIIYWKKEDDDRKDQEEEGGGRMRDVWCVWCGD